MRDVFALAADYGVDPELLTQILAALEPSGEGAPAPRGPAHLRRTDVLGRGGTAEVWLARDERLDRVVAMKVLRADLAGQPSAHDGFVREARATARLVHPGIVPVHEIGALEDGRPFFTMDVVQGRTLDQWLRDSPDAGLHRRVDVLRRAVDAVAYAHGRGVLHRDLKPTNVMVGAFGTVVVLDWGLMRWNDLPAGSDTRFGVIQGTPGYLSPEQARGEPVGPATDVFALGLVLFEIVHGVRAVPFDDPLEAVATAARGWVPPIVAGPDTLRAVLARALAPSPADRYADGSALADALGRWLDGEAQRARAQALVDEAAGLAREQTELLARADGEDHLAETLLRGVERWAPAESKVVGWDHQDRARDLREAAHAVALRRMQALHGALTHDPDHPGALATLADHWLGVHRAAEARRDAHAAREARAQLAWFDRGRHAAYLEGRGRLAVTTVPAGVPAVLFRLVERERRLVPLRVRDLGPTPCAADGLEMGSWLVQVGEQGVPVWIRRGTSWEAPPIVLPAGSPPEDRLVPGGPFWAGDPGDGFQSLPFAEVHLDPFVIRRDPVTHREFITFLDDLVAAGREDDALRWAPHERGARPDAPGPQCYGRTADGRFILAPDAEGDQWDLDWPVFLVDHHAARAYAAWLAARTGLPWRLPTELEWEKAARGVDGRPYPWGDRFDPSFACVRASHRGRPLPARVDAFPVDTSVYGVRGMAGNMRDWCLDPFVDPKQPGAAADEQKVLKGGCWYFPESGSHLAARYALDATNRGDTVSFRVARSVG